MLHQLSQNITDFLITREVINKEDAEIYVYGYEMMISGIIDFLITMIIGILLGCPLNAVIFFVMFVSVRLYSGGYHANTYVKCKVIMTSIFLAVLVISSVKLPLSAVCILMLLLIVTVHFHSPIENQNKPLDDMEKRKYHWISVILSVLWGITAMIVYFFSITISVTIASTGLFITMLMIVAIYGKEVSKDEKAEYNP